VRKAAAFASLYPGWREKDAGNFIMAGKKVLVVEDHEENRRLLRDLLTTFGYELTEAVSGEDGLIAAEANPPDLILMDIQLPGMDGYEVTRRIKGNPALCRVPVIAVTSYALSGDDVKALQAGCDGYVTKPFDPAELLEKIRGYIG
jgi:two-component system cell cycle response regulator DivK